MNAKTRWKRRLLRDHRGRSHAGAWGHAVCDVRWRDIGASVYSYHTCARCPDLDADDHPLTDCCGNFECCCDGEEEHEPRAGGHVTWTELKRQLAEPECLG